MAIVKTTYLYEVLARFNENGLQGCHRIEVTKVWDDVTGEVYSEAQGSAYEATQPEAAGLISSAVLAPLPPTE